MKLFSKQPNSFFEFKHVNLIFLGNFFPIKILYAAKMARADISIKFFFCYKLTYQTIKYECKNGNFLNYILFYFKNSSQYQIKLNLLKCFFILLFFLTKDITALKYERELKYLEYYMGIAPANEDGSIYVNGNMKVFVVLYF